MVCRSTSARRNSLCSCFIRRSASRSARCCSIRRFCNVASSCDSLATRSGLSRVARTCPLAAGSPAWIFRATMPGAGAYNVGLTAATTWPSAATSCTKLPRSTVAIVNLERSIEASAPEKRRSAAPTVASSTTAPPMTTASLPCRRQKPGASRARSWRAVSLNKRRPSLMTLHGKARANRRRSQATVFQDLRWLARGPPLSADVRAGHFGHRRSSVAAAHGFEVSRALTPIRSATCSPR